MKRTCSHADLLLPLISLQAAAPLNILCFATRRQEWLSIVQRTGDPFAEAFVQRGKTNLVPAAARWEKLT